MNTTVYETNSPEETRALGKKIGALAGPGDVYTLVGDLGVGKTVFTQGIAEGLGITEPVSSPTLRLCRYMRRDGCRSIILTFTGLGIWKRWKRLAMRITFTGRGSA